MDYTIPLFSEDQVKRVEPLLDFFAQFQDKHGTKASLELRSTFECRWLALCLCTTMRDDIAEVSWNLNTGALLGLITLAQGEPLKDAARYGPPEHAHQLLYLVDDLVDWLEKGGELPEVPSVWPGQYVDREAKLAQSAQVSNAIIH